MGLQAARANDAIFCKISIDDGYTWVQGIITLFSPQNNSMQIYLSSKNFYKCANLKNKLIIKALDSAHENIYIGTLNKNTLNNKSHLLKINIESTLSFYNKRDYVRFLVNYTATIKVNDTFEFRTKISDLSFSGLCFFSKHELKQDSNVSILLNTNHEINLYGNIINKIPYEKEFRYSVSITPKSISDQEELYRVMDSLLLRQNGIKSSYLAHSKLKTLLFALLTLLLFISTTWSLFYYLK